MKMSDILSENQLDELAFFGRKCTKDCSGHMAGWQWERKHKKGYVHNTKSPSFNNGTEIAVNQFAKGLNPIGPQVRGEKGKFTKYTGKERYATRYENYNNK